MTSESTHGHEVIKLIMEKQQGWSRDSLLAEIASRFGKEATFHTCAAEQMSSDQLLDFLEARGKFVPSEGAIQIDTEHLCADMKKEQ